MVFPASNLSQENILRDVHDTATQTLRTSATAIIAPGLEVDIQHTEDSVRLGDGTSYLTSSSLLGKVGLDVNILNSVPVTIPPGASFDSYPLEKGTNRNTYNEVTAVPSSILTTIVTYTVPGGVTGFVPRVEYSGTNIAVYTILVNGVIQDKKRTNYAVSLNDCTMFESNANSGFPVSAGDIVVVKVIHDRPDVGDFNARIVAVEL